jgi:hypothetical protein
MAIKIDNTATVNLNIEKLMKHINSILESVPQAHLRGISKIVIVDRIEEPRLDPTQRAELPGLYHPKLPGSPAWMEVALLPLRSDSSWIKRLGRRLTFKTNVTATLLSLIGQHYYLTLSHGIKKSQYESAVRNYVEKQFAVYTESKRGFRYFLLKPFKPYLEKLGKWLRKRYEMELKKQAPQQTKLSKKRRR